VLIVLPTESYRASDFVRAADALDVELAVASEEEPPIGLEDRFVGIDTRRPESSARALADLAASTPIDAIVAADDAGVVVAALASEMIGLPHNPPDAAAATRNKAVMRRLLETSEIPQPSFAVLDRSDEPAEIGQLIGYPVVVKPLSMSASRGVIRADSDQDLENAVSRIRHLLTCDGRNPNEPLIVEKFMPGPEVAVEGILWGGELEILAVFDKPDPLDGPYFPETIYVAPSDLHPEVLEEVHKVTQRATLALGLREGPIHAELRITSGVVRVVEVAARTIGGICSRSLRFGLLDTPLEVLVLRHALGMRKPGLRRLPEASGVMMIPTPSAGTLRAVKGAERALQVPGITDIEITVPSGTALTPLPEGDRYLGFIFARGGDRRSVVQGLRDAHEVLHFDID